LAGGSAAGSFSEAAPPAAFHDPNVFSSSGTSVAAPKSPTASSVALSGRNADV